MRLSDFVGGPARIALAILLLLAFSAAIVRAEHIELTNYNSTIGIDTTTPTTPGDPVGMTSWWVDGANYNALQWFWLRVGNEDHERALNDLTYTGTIKNSDNKATISYTDPQNALTVATQYLLNGQEAGSGLSNIQELITFRNTGTTPLTLNFFQYCNFNLSDGNDSVQFYGPNHVLQTGPGPYVSEMDNTAEGVVTGFPRHQAGVGPEMFTSLNNGTITNLDNTDFAGPGNANWTFQWTLTIPAGGTKIISKSKDLEITPVPEPSSILLLSLGGFIGFGYLWRKKRA